MDLYSTDTLVGVVASLKRTPMSMADRYFTKQIQDDAEEIHFDIILGKRRVAPFVSPLVAGKVVASQGREVRSFKPAYIKDKRVFDPSKAFKRAIGETIGGSLSAEQRRDAYLASELTDQIEMVDRRLELMGVEAIRTGKTTVVGDDYPIAVVDFKRTAALSPAALAGTARWGESAAKPLTNLKTWSKLVRKYSGTFPRDVIMGEDAFDVFSNDATVRSQLDVRNVTNAQMAMGPQPEEGLVFRGVIDGFNIFSYGGLYVDPADDTEKEIFPAGEIVLASVAVEGVRAFGAIKDTKCLQALPYFPKMFDTDDPSATFLLLQSAPLMVPSRPDATLGVQVLG